MDELEAAQMGEVAQALMSRVEQRSFINSYGRTSSTSSTPAFSSGGLPSAKSSSSTQAVNGSATTGHRSLTPKSRRTSAAISKVVAGVIRSTIELGNSDVFAPPTRPARDLGCSALASTVRPATSPLFSMLSQDTIVGAAIPAVRDAGRAPR